MQPPLDWVPVPQLLQSQHIILQKCLRTAPHRTAQHSAAQRSTAQHSTAQLVAATTRLTVHTPKATVVVNS
jgi:hypothetical protein